MKVLKHLLPVCPIIIGLVVILSCSPRATEVGAIQPKPAESSPVVARPATTEWETLLAAAKKEGTVTYYMEAGSETRTAVSQAFYEKYGIRVEMVIGKGAELLAKIKTERQAGIYWADLSSIGETSTIALKGTGALTPLDRYLVLPELKDPQAWPDGQPRFSDKQHMAVTLGYYYQPFILTNTGMVKKDEIRSHLDLLDPRWKGKITLFDPTIGAGQVWVGWLQKTMGEQWTDKFFRQLVKQDLVITRDSRLHSESIARGKFPVGIGYSMSATGNLLQIGAPISPLSTAEGGLLGTGSALVAMMDKAPRPNAAAVLINWLLSKEGARIYAEAANYIPVRQDINPTWIHPNLIPPKGVKLFWPDEDFRKFLNDEGADIAKKYFGELMK